MPKHFSKSIDVKEILKQENFNIEYVPTKLGALKIAFDDSIYEYCVTKKGFKFYCCSNKPKDGTCPAYIGVYNKRIYVIEAGHKH